MFDALKARSFDAVVALAHPLALARFKKSQSAFVQLQAFAAQAASDREEQTGCETPAPDPMEFLRQVLGVPSPDELDRASPTTLLERWLKTVYGHSNVRVPARTIIGTVPEGDSQTHVLFREEEPITDPTPGPWVDVVASNTVRVITTVKGPNDGWYVMLNGGIVFDESGVMRGFGWGSPGDSTSPAA